MCAGVQTGWGLSEVSGTSAEDLLPGGDLEERALALSQYGSGHSREDSGRRLCNPLQRPADKVSWEVDRHDGQPEAAWSRKRLSVPRSCEGQMGQLGAAATGGGEGGKGGTNRSGS